MTSSASSSAASNARAASVICRALDDAAGGWAVAVCAVAAALHSRLGYAVMPIDGASHFVAWDSPVVFAAAIAAHLEALAG